MARYNIKRLTPQTHYKASIMLYNLKRGIIPDYVTWEVKEEYKLFAKLKAEIPKICCASCGATDNLELDHIKPLCRGGKTEKGNLQWLCHKCHTNKTKQEFGWDKPFGELPDLAI